MKAKLMWLASSMLAAAARPAFAQSAAPAGGTMIEEIIVTAQRTEQNLQKVPIAVQAFSGERLQQLGATESRDLQTLVPGLTFTRNFALGFPYIRGVGQNTTSLGFESPNALYVDGVYIPGGSGNLFSFNNVERIEVLKGPQGTLFGRNAAGGVIQVISRTPSEHMSVEGMLGYGNYQTYDGQLYATGGGHGFAMDIALVGHDQVNGWGHSLNHGHKVGYGYNFGLRTSFIWKPMDKTEVRGFATRVKVRDDFGATPQVYPGTLARDGTSRFLGPYLAWTLPSPPNDLATSTIAGITVSHEMGAVKITNIVGYNRTGFGIFENQQGFEGSATAPITLINTNMTERSVTEEFQVTNTDKSSRLQWIAGFFYLADNFARLSRNGAFTPSGVFTGVPGDAYQYMSSYAGYAQATYAILPTTRITGGIRYTKDLKKYVGRPNVAGPLIHPPKVAFSKPTWRLAVDHDLTDGVMLFASYNRGFKSGAFNATLPPTPPNDVPVRPEIIDAYEAGFKSEWLDRRLRLNASAYYYKYTDLQVRAIISGATTILTNAATAKIKGLEVEAQANPAEGLLLTGSVSLLDAKYNRFPGGPISLPLPAGGALGGLSADLSGNRLARSPKFTFTLGALYTITTDMGDFSINGKLFHSAHFYWEPDNFLTQPSYTVLDGSIGWTPKNGRYGLELWARNIANTRYYMNGSTAGSYFVNLDAPRTFGVRVKFKYD